MNANGRVKIVGTKLGELYIAIDCSSLHTPLLQLGTEDSTGTDLRGEHMAVPRTGTLSP